MHVLQKRVEEYRQRADDLRKLAKHLNSPVYRDQFLAVATEWERLADLVEGQLKQGFD